MSPKKESTFLWRLQRILKRSQKKQLVRNVLQKSRKAECLLGESLCQYKDVCPNSPSVDGSVNSPPPGLLLRLLFLLDSSTEGEVELVAVLESSEKLSVSLAGCRLTVKDRSILGTPSVNVAAAACIRLVSLTTGLSAAEEWLSFTLPETETARICTSKLLVGIRKLTEGLGRSYPYDTVLEKYKIYGPNRCICGVPGCYKKWN